LILPGLGQASSTESFEEGLQRHHNLHEPDILRRIEAASPFAMQADAA
jgi:hypothetical protein